MIIELLFFPFCEKNSDFDKVRDHCHLTGKNQGLAHNKSNFSVTQKPSSFVQLIFHNFGNYDCHLLFKKCVDTRNNKVKFDIIPWTNEEYLSIPYEGIRLVDSCHFFSSSLVSFVKTLVDRSRETLESLKKNTGDDNLSNIANEIETLTSEGRTSKDFRKDFPN